MAFWRMSARNNSISELYNMHANNEKGKVVPSEEFLSPLTQGQLLRSSSPQIVGIVPETGD